MLKRDLKSGLLLCFICLSLDGSPIGRFSSIGAREASLSMAVISQPGAFSVFHNQAFLSFHCTAITGNQPVSAAISLRQPFLIRGYNESALAVVVPSRDITFAFGLTHSGIEGYSETSLGIALAKPLTRKLSAGLLFNYLTFNLPEIGQNKGSFQLEGGLAYLYSEILSFGLHIRNIISTPCSTFQYNIAFPVIFRGGISCHLTDKILLSSEIALETKTAIEKKWENDFCFGLEYLLQENFFLRSGMSTNPLQHSFGFGYKWRFCQLDFALVHLEYPGYTPCISLSYNFKPAPK